MWKKGFLCGYYFEAKVYEMPSEYGVEGGRISKLYIRKDGKVACNYDRGWDIEPTPEARAVYETILKTWN